MHQRTLTVLGIAAFIAVTLACSKSQPLSPTLPAITNSAPADGSTLKASAPRPQSPMNDVRISEEGFPTLTIGTSSTTFTDNVALQYRFELFDEGGTRVAGALVGGPSWQVIDELEFDKRYTWRARAENGGDAGPWSELAAFRSPDAGYIRGSKVYDPLINGKTVGKQFGGRFVPGQGWQALTTSDSIDYDITTCASCTLEFDITNFGEAEGAPFHADLKFFSMGEAPAYDSFFAFRDHPWKMHLEQRADGDGTAMKLIWRTNGEDDDHNAVVPPNKAGGPAWDNGTVFHFVVDWNHGGFTIAINGKVWFADDFEDGPYAPPNHRISLGTRPRSETMIGAIWRNVKVTPH
jgi:hypothetical protein